MKKGIYKPLWQATGTIKIIQMKSCQCDRNPGFFCENSILNSFVKPKLISTPYPEELGNLYAIFFAKVLQLVFFHKFSKLKIQVICTFLIYMYIQIICKTTTSYYGSYMRSHPHHRDILYAIFCQKIN